MRRVLMIAILLLVAGCDSAFPVPPPPSTAPTARSVVSDEVRARMGTVALLFSCIPGSSPPSSPDCDWDWFSGRITAATAAIRDAVADSPNPHEHVNLTVVADDMDAASAAFTPCAEWFDSNGAAGDPSAQAACSQSWDELIAAWNAVESAVDVS